MFSSKHNAAKKPTIRREKVRVPVKKQQVPNGAPKAAANAPANRFTLTERKDKDGKSAAQAKKQQPQAPVQKAVAAVSRGVKRKSMTPEVHFSSEEESDSSDGGTSASSGPSRKRPKSSVSSVESHSGPKRDLVLRAAFEERVEPLQYIQGADATSGVYAAKFKNPWEHDEFHTVDLQYPSCTAREKFELKWPKNEKDDYRPMEDVAETIKHICSFYLPESLKEKYCNEETGFVRRFTRAWQHQSITDWKAIVEDFNDVLKPLLSSGTIQQELSNKRHIPLDVVRRILDQIYARTVSPKVETLRAYQNGSDNVYGELLPRFCSAIFRQTHIADSSVFIDLGSGVGNVVLQAALEIGCESWGIEMMKNPCDLADLQAKEFPTRTHLWGLTAGAVKLLRGDFTDNAAIAPVLQKADVVLVNNQAFTPALNDKLLSMFLDLKDGCQVVSLKPFVPEGHKISLRNISSVANLFVQRRLEYFSGSVSWTDQSGYYYIATKDPRPLEKFMKAHSGLGR